jgi:hypothetical protein
MHRRHLLRPFTRLFNQLTPLGWMVLGTAAATLGIAIRLLGA